MKNKVLAIVLAITTAVAALSFTACQEKKSEYPVTAGSVTVKSEPKKIVVLNKNYADIISCIGFDAKIAGRSDSVNQKGMDVVPSVGLAADPSFDKIKSLKADVVFADDSLNTTVKDNLEKSGITVIIPEQSNTPKQVKNIYIQFGSILGGKLTGKAKAKEAFDDLYDELKDLEDTVEDKDVVTTICYIYSDNGVLKTMTNSTWGGRLLSYTGAVNVFKDAKSDVIDAKKLMLSNPDYIFCEDKEVAKTLKTSDSLSGLKAMNDSTRRFVVSYDDITMQGKTSIETVKKMISKIYPGENS